MSEKMKLPDNNPCNFKMVSHCYYQDTNKQLNLQLCTNCILSRCEKHLFSIVNSKNKTLAKRFEEVNNELSTRESIQG